MVVCAVDKGKECGLRNHGDEGTHERNDRFLPRLGGNIEVRTTMVVGMARMIDEAGL